VILYIPDRASSFNFTTIEARTLREREEVTSVSPYANRASKRLIDVVLGLMSSFLTLPIVVIVALASAVSFRAWPFFTQTRLGIHGRPFRFVKIRSLPKNFNPNADKYVVAETKNTFVGNFLRRTHLDDLPQLWLVVSGQMSMVGPRPELPSIAERFDPNFVATRTLIRPGVTGLWQLSTGSQHLIGEHPEFDEFYVANASFRFDCWLMAQTFRLEMGGQPLSIADVQRFAR